MKTTTLFKKISMYLVMLLAVTNIYAQTIAGKVMDGNTKEFLPFVNVLNLNAKDSTLISGTVTGDDGSFTLTSSPEKSFLRISYVGFKTKNIECNPGISSYGNIELDPSDEMLKTVIITGRQQMFKLEAGGISTNISNNPRLKNLGTAINVLEQLPFVFNDNGNLTVVGKGEPLIYINNRLVRDKGELDRLSSNDIKRTIVITNPGPEYDSTVSSVIKIETIRPVGEGLGGEVGATANIRRKFSHNENISLNYRKGGLDIFGSIYYLDNKEVNIKALEQQVETPTAVTVVKQGTDEGINIKYTNYTGGINYIVSPKHSLGAKYTYRKQLMEPDIDILANVYVNDKFHESFRSLWMWEADRPSHLVNAYYNGNLASWLTVKFDFDYYTGTTNHWQHVNVIYQDTDETVETDSKQDFDLYAGKLILTTPLAGSNLVYGGEYSHTSNEQNFFVEKNESSGELSSNINVAEQKLFAAFASYSKPFGKFSFSAGLRFENVSFNYTANGVIVNEQSKAYRNLFPNAMITYQDQNWQMMLSYRATTSRPSYSSLSNRMQYDGPYTYETGNPFLKPTRINDVSLSFLWKDLSFMASYKLYRDQYLQLVQQYDDTNIILYKPENVDKSQDLTISAYYSPTIGIWKPNLGVNFMKNFLEYGEISQTFNKPYFRFSLQNSLKFSDTFVCGVDFRANTAGNNKMNYIYESFSMNVNISKTFFKNSLILNAHISDVLNTDKQKFKSIGPKVHMLMDNEYDSRGVVLSVKYRFNTTRNKYRGSSAAGDELRRM